MKLKNLHTKNKSIQTNALFNTTEGKVISLQIAAGQELIEHITKVPALLVCVNGNAVYNDANNTVINIKSGVYIEIEKNLKHWIKAIEESNFLLIK